MIPQNTKQEILDQYRQSQQKFESYQSIEINDNMTLTFEVSDGRLNLMLSIKNHQLYYETFDGFKGSIKGQNPKLDRIVNELSDIVGVDLDFYCEPHEQLDKHYWISNTFY